MSTPLDPLRRLQGSGQIGLAPAGGDGEVARTPEGRTFADVLGDFVRQVDNAQKDFDHAIQAVERGETDNLHQVMIAQSQAHLSLKLAAEVRNKLVEAYREVMRTQF